MPDASAGNVAARRGRGRPPGATGLHANRLFGESLNVVLKRQVIDGDTGKTKTNMMLVAESLVREAINGDISAIKEVADRCDGKVSFNHSVVDQEGNEVPGSIAIVFVGSKE